MSTVADPEAPTWAERAARDAHQVLRREVNEQIDEISSRFLNGETGELVVMCECAHLGCTARIALPRQEYEAVRQFPTRFLVKEGHEVGDAERLVGEAEGYVIVEKVGAAARYAVTTDPRARSATA